MSTPAIRRFCVCRGSSARSSCDSDHLADDAVSDSTIESDITKDTKVFMGYGGVETGQLTGVLRDDLGDDDGGVVVRGHVAAELADRREHGVHDLGGGTLVDLVDHLQQALNPEFAQE